MKRLILRMMLKFLVRKRRQENISHGYPAYLQNDHIVIHLKSMDDDKLFRLESVGKNTIQCSAFKDKERKERLDKEFNFDEIKKLTVQILYYYKGWRIFYDNIWKAFSEIRFSIVRFRWYRYSRYVKNIENAVRRMELLRILIKLYMEAERPIIYMDKVCDTLYGKKYMRYQKWPFITEFQQLQFMLQSLKQSGDINFSNESVIKYLTVLPKALETLARHEIDMSKHGDSLRIAKGQLFVAWIMVLLVFLNFVLGILSFRSGKKLEYASYQTVSSGSEHTIVPDTTVDHKSVELTTPSKIE